MTTNRNNIDYLLELEKKFLNSSKNILLLDNQNIYSLDFIALTVNNRAIELISGFKLLVQNEYYLCAIPLIRLQLDNALRFYATFLINDINDFINYFLSGKPIKEYLDISNKKLSDSYLTKKLDAIFPGVINLYKNLSAHIHLSDQHFFAMKTNPFNENSGIKIGANSKHVSNDIKTNYLRQMIDISNIVLLLVAEWEKQKGKKHLC